MFAADSGCPPARRRERHSPSTWPAAAAEKAAAERSAHRHSGKPEWHRGASLAGRESEERGDRGSANMETKEKRGEIERRPGGV